jgi:FkbM family methyltransferase
MERVREKLAYNFMWSHQGAVHRILVRVGNGILNLIPLKLKYKAVIPFKKTNIPYSLVNGKTVVQVGAPYDTLNAGRSRGMLFSLIAGAEGKVVIIEPLSASVNKFKEALTSFGINNTLLVNCGAWSERGESYINVDEKHPATNFTGETVDYSAERNQQFKKVPIKLETIDAILADLNINDVDLISITTNWAEEEILSGMQETLKRGVEYICLAYGKDGEDYEELMKRLGYKPYSHDDRGVTYMLEK